MAGGAAGDHSLVPHGLSSAIVLGFLVCCNSAVIKQRIEFLIVRIVFFFRSISKDYLQLKSGNMQLNKCLFRDSLIKAFLFGRRSYSMTDSDSPIMDKHVIKMASLGRRFQLGDLYNYRNDHILEGNKLKSFRYSINNFLLHSLCSSNAIYLLCVASKLGLV